MIRFFIDRYAKDMGGTGRKTVGIICAWAGIIFNLLLFFVKLIAGSISSSVAVTADAVHNLTDMASSAVTLISFLLPEKNKEIKENLAGLTIGAVLIAAGIRMITASAEKIAVPEQVEFSCVSVILLIISVSVKFYMAYFNGFYGRKISSAALNAASLDCLCDSLATTVALSAMIASCFTSVNIDAYGGLAVSLLILAAGIKTAVESVRELVNIK